MLFFSLDTVLTSALIMIIHKIIAFKAHLSNGIINKNSVLMAITFKRERERERNTGNGERERIKTSRSRKKYIIVTCLSHIYVSWFATNNPLTVSAK